MTDTYDNKDYYLLLMYKKIFKDYIYVSNLSISHASKSMSMCL